MHGSKASLQSELNSISNHENDDNIEIQEQVFSQQDTERLESRYRSKRIKQEPHPYLSKGYEELIAEEMARNGKELTAFEQMIPQLQQQSSNCEREAIMTPQSV